MPQIKIERIISFTSEDAAYPASNLLSNDASKKWKCKSQGEKSASVVLQLDQPYNINNIDIGNENSAYVEVLVSRSIAPDDFKVLLVMSSFMTPLESRQSQNVNKVRMFKRDDFSDPEKNEKWDRIKIVCTQPFNRHVQYGLTFVNLYSSDGKNVDKPQQPSVGKFTIRPASPEAFSAGSLFARRKELLGNSDEAKLKGAAAIREATALAHSSSPASKQKLKLNLPTTPKPRATTKAQNEDDEESSNVRERNDRNRNELLYSKDEEDKHDKIDKLIEKRDELKKAEESKKVEKDKQKDKKKDKDKHTPSKDSKNRKKERTDTPTNTPNRGSDSVKHKKDEKKGSASKEPMKRKHREESAQQSSKKKKKESVVKPFARLLEGVVLVISGIQNPDRASLRTMAMSMGSKYKPDWDDTCTHLICAFANTPKFNQVKGKGKIVTRRWIEDCYHERKRLPWRRYALDKADKGPESEDEICEKDDSPSPEPVQTDYRINSDTDDDDTKAQGSDTDEKIAEIRRKQAESKPVDVFSGDTDNESNDSNIHMNLDIVNKLDDFFEEKIFYVDDTFDSDTEKRIKQYILAYNGILVENLEESIDIIVTKRKHYKALKDLYPTVICIAADWIWECHNNKKMVSMNNYIYE